MTDTPKRMWVVDEKPATDICWRDNIFFTDEKASACGWVLGDMVQYHRADLSADLVRAALEAAAKRSEYHKDARNSIYGKSRTDAGKAIRAMSSDPDAIAAIVARVTEGK